MKGGLHQPPLAQPEVALAEQQAVAEQRTETPRRLALAIVVVARHQHLFDEQWMTNDHHRGQAEANAHQVAIVARDVRQQAQRVAAQIGQKAQDAALRRAGADGRSSWLGFYSGNHGDTSRIRLATVNSGQINPRRDPGPLGEPVRNPFGASRWRPLARAAATLAAAGANLGSRSA